MEVATHTITVTAADTATRRRRLGVMTADKVKQAVIGHLADEGITVGAGAGDAILREPTVVEAGQADQGVHKFDVTIVSRAEYAGQLTATLSDGVALSGALAAKLGTVVSVSEPSVAYRSVCSDCDDWGSPTRAPAQAPAASSIDYGELNVGESNISEVEADQGWLVPVVVILSLILLCPLLGLVFVRSRYGSGKTYMYLRWKCSHTNPVSPIFYLPKDVRERLRVDLNSSTV